LRPSFGMTIVPLILTDKSELPPVEKKPFESPKRDCLSNKSGELGGPPQTSTDVLGVGKIQWGLIFHWILLLLFCVPAPGMEQAEVAGVLSGNRIRLEDGRIVRYIGVGIPDFSMNGRSAKQLARMSHQYNRQLVDRKKVRLIFDNKRTGPGGELLAYVHQGDLFVNERMIEAGMALLETDPANARWTRHFKMKLRQAKKNKVGYWQPLHQPTPTNPIPALNPRGKIVFTQPGDKFFYPRGHSKLGLNARPLLIEDALEKGLRPYPLKKENEE
jgi:endonuclease YncB( thermonuclease family)